MATHEGSSPMIARAPPASTSRTVSPDAAVAVDSARYGGLVTRAIACAIDAALINAAALAVAAVVALVLSIFPVSHHMKSALAVAGGVLFAAWVVVYFVGFWTTTGATPGCHLMRMRVERLDGTALRPMRALLRLAGLVLGLPLFAGYVPILLSERRRGLQDLMGGTVVVNQPRERDTYPTRGTLP